MLPLSQICSFQLPVLSDGGIKDYLSHEPRVVPIRLIALQRQKPSFPPLEDRGDLVELAREASLWPPQERSKRSPAS